MKDVIIDSVTQLDEEKVIFLVKRALKKGISPKEILLYLQEGLKNVGDLFASEDYFLSDLIMAGIIYKRVFDMDEIKNGIESASKVSDGRIVIGTIQDDVHDIGKAIFIGMAVSAGYDVIDLGIDVSIDIFIDKVKEYKPDILGISCLLNSGVKNVTELLAALDAQGLRNNFKIIVGGLGSSQLDAVSTTLKADAYVLDAETGLNYCRVWTEDKSQ